VGKATRWKPGQERVNGRIRQPRTRAEREARAKDHGNLVIQARRELFGAMCIKGGKAADQVNDAIGQLWALDYLDGAGIDDTALRDAGREFAELYWTRYQATAPKVGQYERASRTTHQFAGLTARDARFDRMDQALDGVERQAVVDCIIDPWFTEAVPGWAQRLISHELMQRGRIKFCERVPDSLDRIMVNALVRGLCDLVEGSRRRQAA
jgi:hypothetical protein